MIDNILLNVQKKTPLVHFITNYVTVNDCANIVLATGGSPIMADDAAEVEDITSICNSLVINIGTLNERTIESMIKAGKKANECNHPVVLDPVGVGASQLRNQTALRLLKEVKFTVIRGNMSEIKFLATGSGNTQGVDADINDKVTDENISKVISFAKDLSKNTKAVIAISGAIDIVADDKKAYVIKNGHPVMSRITGTGCMLGGVIGSFAGANQDNTLDATAYAVVSMGLCGELAYQKMKEMNGGTGSFRTYLIDAMSNLTPEVVNGGMKIEQYQN